MTRQQIFTKVKNHLLKQMKRSEKKKGGKCMYRGPKGLQCAVGCLIPDNLYDPKMDSDEDDDGLNVFGLIRDFPTLNPLKLKRNQSLLSELQSIHDQLPPKDWKSALKEAARFYRLKF